MSSSDLERMLQGCSAHLLYSGVHGASAQCHVCCPLCWFGSLEAVIKCSMHSKGGVELERHLLGRGFLHYYLNYSGSCLLFPFMYVFYQYRLMCSLCTLVMPSTTIFILLNHSALVIGHLSGGLLCAADIPYPLFCRHCLPSWHHKVDVPGSS